jgi:hypothetical protein
MSRSKKRWSLWFAILALGTLAGSGIAQQTDSSVFRIAFEAGGGYCYKVTQPKSLLGIYTRDGIAGTIRLKWGTSNMIGVGVESGWLPISTTSATAVPSEFGPVSLEARLAAIPLLGIMSIQRLGVQCHVGLGYYHVLEHSTMMGETDVSSEWDLGFMIALGYASRLSERHRIGFEVKWNNITEQQISIVSVQARYIVRLVEW